MENQETQIPMAFLVDGENASASLIKEMLTEASRFGPILVRNVYGDWTRDKDKDNMKGWKEARLEHALHPIQQFSNVSEKKGKTGKNASDIALVIDAMDMLHEGIIKGFCIVSSDSDFTSLAMRLRRSGAFVLGIGKEYTCASFKRACDRFVMIENLAEKEEPKPSESTAKGKNDTEAIAPTAGGKRYPGEALELVSRAYGNIEREGGYALMSDLGNALNKLEPEFDFRTYGKKNLTELIEALRDSFVIGKNEGGPGADYVRKQTQSVAGTAKCKQP